MYVQDGFLLLCSFTVTSTECLTVTCSYTLRLPNLQERAKEKFGIAPKIKTLLVPELGSNTTNHTHHLAVWPVHY